MSSPRLKEGKAANPGRSTRDEAELSHPTASGADLNGSHDNRDTLIAARLNASDARSEQFARGLYKREA